MPDQNVGNADTTLNQGTGGRTIATDDIGFGYNDQGVAVDHVQMPLDKIATGPAGINDGPVTDSNPFPTYDAKCFEVLCDIKELLEGILEALRG